MPDKDRKVKAFIDRILQECEQEGFTIEETLKIPQELRFALEKRIMAIHRNAKFTTSQAQ